MGQRERWLGLVKVAKASPPVLATTRHLGAFSGITSPCVYHSSSPKKVFLTLRQSFAVVLALVSGTLAKDWESPEYKWLYEFPLPIPPPKTEKFQPIIDPVTGKKIRYYEIEIKEFTAQVYPNLGPAKLVGYHGISPGPTFLMERGEEAVVRFTNHAKLANSVHSHCSPSDGSLYSPAKEEASLYGDVIHVNGQLRPYLRVEPRKYRFRLLDASISRTFFLYLEDIQHNRVRFDVISSDAGLLTGPQSVTELYISMAERYEIVLDFSFSKGQNITMHNTRSFAADIDYLHTDKVMHFVAGDNTVSDTTSVPSALRTVPFPKDKAGIDQHFRFERQGGSWRINGVTFADVNNRVLARPKRGTIEVWELENSSGGWSHPIHIHLVDCRVVKRVNGRSNVVFPYESQGLKDVVCLGPGETVTVEVRYAPWPGVYMFHFHNLIHEDHEMMAAFNVSVLADLGYYETQLADPEWRAKTEDPAAYVFNAVKSRIEYMAKFQPYNNVEEVESRLDAYWATKTNAPSTSSTASTLIVSTTPTSTPVSPTITAKPTTTSMSDDDKKKDDDKKNVSTTTTMKKKRGMRARRVDMEMPKRTTAAFRLIHI
ncbi:multicopper oxidase [Colletotrichum graminicola M1.001]|uniref:Multicopper oxidase n=1 Tax=Colletotrichum graminicola (strain M1.001 / M2 / FGSC 10212) TaxID=645133 RepID=E3QVC1_COLGM|nr:multicopper oxidase [Colletotrichum graminicola M1.001]EFQ34809.1 multicopper oxidase [Colletotrichum graminicola M1.001]